MRGRRTIELHIGGPSWSGWRFGPWGRAREWRLCSPTGENFTAGDVADLRALQLDVNYLQTRNRELTAQLDHTACYFSGGDADTLRAAASILNRSFTTSRLRAA